MSEAKINIGVGGGDAVIGYMERIKKTANEYYNMISKSAGMENQSGINYNKMLAEQLKLLEKKQKYESGKVIEQIQRERALIKSGDPERQQKLDALTARQTGIVSGGVESNEAIKTLKDLLGVNKKGVDEQHEINKTLKAASVMNKSIDMITNAAMSSNIYSAIVSGSSSAMQAISQVIPKVGGIVGKLVSSGGEIVNKMIASAEDYQTAVTGTYAQTGKNKKGFGVGMEGYGLGESDAIRQFGGLARARGAGYAESQTMNDWMLQKGLGLSQGDVFGLEKSLRGTGQTGRGVVNQFGGGLQSLGMMSGGDMSMMPEYLRTLVGLNQDQLSKLGEVDVGINEKLIMGVSSLDKSFKNPEVLGSVVNKIKGGLSEAGTPQAEALQYQVLAGMAGGKGKSFIDLQEMRENPTIEYFKGVMDQLKKISGGNNPMYIQNIKDFFGTSVKMARGIAGTNNLEEAYSKINAKNGLNLGDGKTLEQRTVDSTSALLKSSLEFKNTFATTGDKIVTAMAGWISSIDKLETSIGNLVDETQKSIIENQKLQNKLANKYGIVPQF